MRFPCIRRPYPESAQHALDALGTLPEPITAPLKPGRTGNSLRLRYQRLLTLDRDDKSVVDRRRTISTDPYQCPAGQDKDEYPPAAVQENGASAHIKCVTLSDNRGAGSTLALQWNRYKITDDPAEPPQPRLDDGDTIEFVVLQ